MEPQSSDDALKKDLFASVQTRKELGAEYESELVDSFLDRLDSRLRAQVEERVERELARRGADDDRRDPRHHRDRAGRPRRPRDNDTWFAMFSLIIAIPLSAIALGVSHGQLLPLLAVWAGIVAINGTRAVSIHARAGAEIAASHRERPRGDWH